MSPFFHVNLPFENNSSVIDNATLHVNAFHWEIFMHVYIPHMHAALTTYNSLPLASPDPLYLITFPVHNNSSSF